jgi:hypothetical protein
MKYKNLLKLHFRRFEFKYPLNLGQYQSIKSQVSRRLKVDPFAKGRGWYLVNSTYFDTPTLTAYRQANAGLKHRVKYRLRTYNQQHQGPVFWEQKRKQDMVVFKDRGFLSPKKTKQLIEATSSRGVKDKTIQSFLFAKHRYFLKPVVLVRYRREPFISHLPKLRITFDHTIQATPLSQSTPLSEARRDVQPQTVVMEIKFTGSLPFWLADIVRSYNLERSPFSKYALSLKAARPRLI